MFESRLLAVLAVFALALLALGNEPAATATRPSKSVVPLTAAERELVDAINEYRQRHGCAPLVVDRRLQAAASGRAGVRDHDGFLSAARRHGYRGSAVSENLAWGYSDGPDCVGGWSRSRGHDKNMLGNWQHVGVGVRGTSYVAMFGHS
jgi:uncharacterized protein YkwD